ncbi:MAG: hypothetical protein WHT65_08925 [Pseudothermotoga sp.]
MQKIFLMSLRLYDSKDAQFPLAFEQVTNLKKEIFLEFLRFEADEHVVVDLFGDLALPEQIFEILSLVPKRMKICQSDGLLNNLKLPRTIELTDERQQIELSSNPLMSENPAFLLLKDGESHVVESSVKGLVPKALDEPANLPDGFIGYIPTFVTSSQSELAKLFGNRVAFVCRDPKDTIERKFAEKVSHHTVCSLIKLLDFCEG